MAPSQDEVDSIRHARDLIDVALREHDFDKRERSILDVVYLATLGHLAAPCFARRIPGLKIFTAMAPEISKGNVSQILKRLRQNLVIIAEPVDYYAFRLPTEFWKYPRPRSPEVLNGFLDLHYQVDELQGALRETFLSQLANLPTRGAAGAVLPNRSSSPSIGAGQAGGASRESAGSGSGGGGTPLVTTEAGQIKSASPSNTSPVPKTGTAPSGSRFGNQRDEAVRRPLPVRALPVVPDSGTAPSLQDWPRSLGTTQDSKVVQGSKLAEPKMGTFQPSKLGQGALSGEKQDAFEQMETLGFWSNDLSSKWNWLKFVHAQPLDLINELIGDVRYKMTRETLAAPGAYANWLVRKKWRVW